MRKALLTLAGILLLSAASGRAEAASVLDTRAVPCLDDAGRASYEAWLRANLPRAIAIAPGGKTGWAAGGGGDTIGAVREQAAQLCAAKAPGCAIYAENLNIVWPGQQSHTPPPTGALLKTVNLTFVPDEHFIWRGPTAAGGVVAQLRRQGKR